MSHIVRFYVTWWVKDSCEPPNEEIFDHEREVLALLNSYAETPDFTFRVVCGYEVEFRPVEVVKAYARVK